MIKNLTIILSSTVLASLVSSSITFAINKKNASLQHITSERKEWRIEIRKISEEIHKADKENIGLILVKLKTRINAYGNYSNDTTKDSHIWAIIKQIETSKTDLEFGKKKIMLIDYLSLLLKYDWERSKNEIVGNKKLLHKILLFISSLGILLYCYFIDWRQQLNINIVKISILMLLFCFWGPSYSILFGKNKNEFIKREKKMWRMYIGNMISIAILIVLSFIPIYFTVNIDKDRLKAQVLIVVALLIWSVSIAFFESYKSHENKINYLWATLNEEKRRSEKKR